MSSQTLAPLQSVSYVMPVLNEEKYLRAAVLSIFEQEFSGPVEVILALGPSTDKTDAIAAELAASHPVQLVRNPSGTTSAGLNLGVAAAKHDVVVRVDAHSKLNPGYTQLAVAVLNQTGAANVGGVMHAVGQTPFQQAVAWGYTSRFGLGGGSFHVGGQAGPSDSVYLGVFRRSVLLALGGFDESVIRGQDWELNLRIRQAGHVVWFDPRLQVEYHPRSSLKALAKQFFDTGFWRGQLTRKSLRAASPRYFAPPLLVTVSGLGLVLTAVGLAVGQPWSIGVVPLAAYLAAVVLISGSAKGLSLATRVGVVLALPTMHFAWGLGFIPGFLRAPKR